MKALIDPRNNRVCQVGDEFPVARPLFWVDADDTITDRHTYEHGAFVPPVVPVVPDPIEESDFSLLNKQMKALGLCIAQVGGLTVPQMKAVFKAKFDSL